MQFETLVDTRDAGARLAAMKDIFFLSAASSISFANEEKREEFWQRWTAYYIENCAHELFFACDGAQTLGYLSGCSDSHAALRTLHQRIQSYSLFEDLFTAYPAHFHINVHPSARGRGIGEHLVTKYVGYLKKIGVPGVHIVTAAGERNIDFYSRNRFQTIAERTFNNKHLIFMGRSLEH